jgi:integrase
MRTHPGRCNAGKRPSGIEDKETPRAKVEIHPDNALQGPCLGELVRGQENYGVEHDRVFFNTKLGKLNSLGHIFKKISEASELHIYPYKLRYTHAVKLWRHGVNILVISKMLGHDIIDTTMRYLRVEEQENREEYLEQTKGLF